MSKPITTIERQISTSRAGSTPPVFFQKRLPEMLITKAQVKPKELEKLCLTSCNKPGIATAGRYGVSMVYMPDKTQRPIQSNPDIEGTWLDGVQFIFDAKVCSKASFNVDYFKPKNKLKKTHGKRRRQLTHMMTRATYGVPCGFVIHFNEIFTQQTFHEPVTYFLPVVPGMEIWELAEADEVSNIKRQSFLGFGAIEINWHKPPRCKQPRPDVLGVLTEFRKIQFSETGDLVKENQGLLL